MNTLDENDVVHGDLKCENILLTRDDWLLISDFASFKPAKLKSDNPADFTYFFDTSRRRAAQLAPERFINVEVDMFDGENQVFLPIKYYNCIYLNLRGVYKIENLS